MSAVFLDTVGLLALWDRSDQWHEAAEGAFAAIVARRDALLTTSFILLECGNAAARRPYREEVVALRRVLVGRGEVVVPSDEDCQQAWDAYQRGEAGQAGIVAHVSFAVMRRLGLSRAFTYDRHFRAAGFEVLF